MIRVMRRKFSLPGPDLQPYSGSFTGSAVNPLSIAPDFEIMSRKMGLDWDLSKDDADGRRSPTSALQSTTPSSPTLHTSTLNNDSSPRLSNSPTGSFSSILQPFTSRFGFGRSKDPASRKTKKKGKSGPSSPSHHGPVSLYE